MILVLAALVALVIYIEKWSLDHALHGVELDYGPSVLLAAPDEAFEIVTSLSNRSGRFVPFVQVQGFLPAGIEVRDSRIKLSAGPRGDERFSFATFLMPRSGYRRGVTASISRRGRYLFNGAQLSGGDFLGINENAHRVFSAGEIVVYPRESDAGRVSEVMGGYLGDLSVRRFIIEDPVLTVGFREYTGREPMKAISWAQSARAGGIMVKSYDYTTEPSVTVLLNVDCMGSDEDREARIESCYSITHTVCRILEERRISYDFYTNANTSGALSDWSYIAEGLGHKHFFTILEGLGRASYIATEPFAAAIRRVETHSPGSLVIITPTEEGPILPYLRRENAMQTLVIPAGKTIEAAGHDAEGHDAARYDAEGHDADATMAEATMAEATDAEVTP